MAIPTLPKIQIPQAIPNAYGESVRVGHFDILKVVVPPLTHLPPFGDSTVTVLIDGKPVKEKLVEPGNSDLILFDIPPFALKCCWQTVGYTVTNVTGTEFSETLLLLNEGT
ncbi:MULTISPECIES: hypothetical protein [unclassified Pseudomonas]|uniref:hypothetical protein n=1 Tax=unclassified Pseudomonas TaxID=196821 RepID=UPI001113944C|nr:MULTISPECIES: hypothetical protein [unclassified Pseudomonas]